MEQVRFAWAITLIMPLQCWSISKRPNSYQNEKEGSSKRFLIMKMSILINLDINEEI